MQQWTRPMGNMPLLGCPPPAHHPAPCLRRLPARSLNMHPLIRAGSTSPTTAGVLACPEALRPRLHLRRLFRTAPGPAAASGGSQPAAPPRAIGRSGTPQLPPRGPRLLAAAHQQHAGPQPRRLPARRQPPLAASRKQRGPAQSHSHADGRQAPLSIHKPTLHAPTQMPPWPALVSRLKPLTRCPPTQQAYLRPAAQLMVRSTLSLIRNLQARPRSTLARHHSWPAQQLQHSRTPQPRLSPPWHRRRHPVHRQPQSHPPAGRWPAGPALGPVPHPLILSHPCASHSGQLNGRTARRRVGSSCRPVG